MVVCEPSSVGFNIADVEVMKKLPEVCVPLLKALLASQYCTRLECSMRTRISRKRYAGHLLVPYIKHEQKIQLKQLSETILIMDTWTPINSTNLNSFTKFDLLSVEDLCAVDLYQSDLSRHDQMEMVLSSCKQIHKAGFLSSILQSQVLMNHASFYHHQHKCALQLDWWCCYNNADNWSLESTILYSVHYSIIK